MNMQGTYETLGVIWIACRAERGPSDGEQHKAGAYDEIESRVGANVISTERVIFEYRMTE